MYEVSATYTGLNLFTHAENGRSHKGVNGESLHPGHDILNTSFGFLGGGLQTADAFPVIASLSSKNSICEPEQQNDSRDVKPFVLMLACQIKG